MVDEDRSLGWILPAAALLALTAFDLLRAWLPSVLFVVGDAGDTPPLLLGAFALGCLATGALASLTLGRVRPATLWTSGITLTVLGRLGLQASDGGALQAATSSVGVVGVTVAVVALAAGTASGHAARAGLFAGLATAVALHAALGTKALVWREGVGVWLAVGLLLAALVLAAARAAREPGWGGAPGEAGPAWPWLVLAPMLVLVGILTGVPSRAAMASGWPPGPVALVLTLAHGAATAIAVGASRLPTGLTGAGGGALILLGTAIALRPTTPLALAAQLGLAIGIGAVIAALGAVPGRSTSRRHAGTAGAAMLVFGLALFLYYAAYDLLLPFPNRAVLLATAAAAALLGLTAGYLGRDPRSDERGSGQAAVKVAAASLVLAGVVWSAVPQPATLTPAPDPVGSPIRIAVYNVQMGYDVRGRLAVDAQAEVLAAEAPDIVVLNEVDRGWLLTGGQDTLRLLGDRLDLPFVFAPAADEVWGNALLSRYPVTELTIQRLPRGRAPMARSHLAAVLQVADGQELAVVGTHLSHVDFQGDTRLPQARAVAATVARMRDRALPTVVLGDLNAEPGSPELATFQGLVESAVPEDTPTWPAWEPVVQIDHALVSEELRVVDVSVPHSLASDHLAVIVTLELAEP